MKWAQIWCIFESLLQTNFLRLLHEKCNSLMFFVRKKCLAILEAYGIRLYFKSCKTSRKYFFNRFVKPRKILLRNVITEVRWKEYLSFSRKTIKTTWLIRLRWIAGNSKIISLYGIARIKFTGRVWNQVDNNSTVSNDILLYNHCCTFLAARLYHLQWKTEDYHIFIRVCNLLHRASRIYLL